MISFSPFFFKVTAEQKQVCLESLSHMFCLYFTLNSEIPVCNVHVINNILNIVLIVYLYKFNYRFAHCEKILHTKITFL